MTDVQGQCVRIGTFVLAAIVVVGGLSAFEKFFVSKVESVNKSHEAEAKGEMDVLRIRIDHYGHEAKELKKNLDTLSKDISETKGDVKAIRAILDALTQHKVDDRQRSGKAKHEDTYLWFERKPGANSFDVGSPENPRNKEKGG